MEAEKFFKKIREKAFLTDEIQQELKNSLTEMHFGPNDGLISPGYIPTSIYFIQKGLAMGYTGRQKPQAVTWFMNENNFLIPSYFFHQEPGTEFITFLEETTLLALSIDKVKDMINRYEEAFFIFLLLTEDSIRAGKEREYMLRLLPEERYLYIAKTTPFLFARGHFDQLASYLNISRRHFVRIRNNFSRR
ncbi:CRP-like cAMP-binding protein [Mucilaginibacter gotjawali]|nr:CRP-like cAMP-binding protein [Mucilaginibacter gotjawali]